MRFTVGGTIRYVDALRRPLQYIRAPLAPGYKDSLICAAVDDRYGTNILFAAGWINISLFISGFFTWP